MYDCIVIGSGITGSSIAYNLSKKKGKFLVLEKNEDICTGTTKANTAIIHAGYDANPGSMKAKMNVWGSEICQEMAEKLGFPYDRIGSFVVCYEKEDLAKLEKLYKQGKENGVKDLRIIYHDELKEMEENIDDSAYAALYAPTAAIVDPFLMNSAYAEGANVNGVDFKFYQGVEDIKREGDHFLVKTKDSSYETKTIVNAAGLYADEINNMVSDKKYKIRARRGEYLLLDKSTKGLYKHVLFETPSERGKGVVVTPTIDGPTLLGPTSDFIDDKEDKKTTAEKIKEIKKTTSSHVKSLPLNMVITSFSGLRAHEEGDDFVIGESEDGFFNALGIESPGLSSAPAIGIYLSDMVAEKLKLEENSDFIDYKMPNYHTESMTMEERQALIDQDPAFGQIICRCEMVTEGEIVHAINRPLGARSLDGIKRRARATAGRCQGGFCTPRLIEILSRELGIDPEEVNKNNDKSYIIADKMK